MNQTYCSKSTQTLQGLTGVSEHMRDGWVLHLHITEWWAAKSIRRVISEAIHLAIWSEIIRGKWGVGILVRGALKFHAPVSVTRTWQKTRWNWKASLQSKFLLLSLSFLLHLLCTINNLSQSLPLCPSTLTAYPCLSFLACWYSLPSSCQPISLCPGWIYCNQLHHRCWFAIIWKSDLI